ncbi:hypothetical protein TSOC_011525 [Tetrabaena socialis]|uniref:Uncharacterized protein n=1 Tax=Tetrabaena socialis TaxID=47790 RepID=A0A2J7ZQF1_9CHLO|nr:hypothetical protein TSOC_011525 [Tetrabaena socialis]|eukprot:PNH02494.1 hypothetical protein TSOC_011525 [Tetrabaena socialis]
MLLGMIATRQAGQSSRTVVWRLQSRPHDRAALGCLRLSCQEEIRQDLRGCATTVAAVDLLRNRFQAASEAKLVGLQQQLGQLKLRTEDSEFVGGFMRRAEAAAR